MRFLRDFRVFQRVPLACDCRYITPPICLKRPVSSFSSILLGELVAILITIDHVAEEINKTDSSEVHIFSDSQSAIGILKLGWQPIQHKQTVAEIFLSFFLSLSLYTAWRSLSSIIGRCTLYTPGCRMKAQELVTNFFHEKVGVCIC